MLFKMYRDQILELVVKPQLLKGQDFVLKKDGNSGYGKDHNRNIIQVVQKRKNNLKYIFNFASFLDFSPIENCWLLPKQYLAKYPDWNDYTTKDLILESWANVDHHVMHTPT